MLIRSVGMTPQLDLLQTIVRIHLVRSAKLMMADHLGVGDLLPPGLAEEMLGFDGGIAQEAGVGDHSHVFVGGHVVPAIEADFGVVDLEELLRLELC